MSWHLHNIISQYGDFLHLKQPKINCSQVLEELKNYEWLKYNPDKPNIPRDCINVTSLDGSLEGFTGTLMIQGVNADSDFKTPTEVYESSKTIQKLLEPWKPYLGRTQFLRLPPGGYFPPHHDGGKKGAPDTFRLIVPIENANPPGFCWMYGDENNYKPLQWETGKLYYLNTNKKHWLFNASANDSIWLTLNILACDETVYMIRDLVQ